MPLLTDTAPSKFSKTTLAVNAAMATVIGVAEVVTRVWPEFAPLVSTDVAKAVAGALATVNTLIQLYKLYFPTTPKEPS